MKNRFVRDIAVNVVANLIAAAIIYLLGILVGLFPRTAAAVELAISIILVASVAAMVMAIISRSRIDRQQVARHWSMYVTAIAFITSGIATAVAYLIVMPTSNFERMAGTLMGIALVTTGCGALAVILDARRAHSRSHPGAHGGGRTGQPQGGS